MRFHHDAKATMVSPAPAEGSPGLRTARDIWITAAISLAFTSTILLTSIGSKADLEVPLAYQGDAIYFLNVTKTLIQGHLPWSNPNLAAPQAADWRDFPMYLPVEYVSIWIGSWLTANPALILNVVWILAVLTTGLLAGLCFSYLGLPAWLAGSLGGLYACQPFTWYRNIGHFNTVYIFVPVICTIAVEIASGRLPHSSGKLRRGWSGVPWWWCATAIAVGLSYIYNAFFACFTLAVASLLGLARHGARRSITVGAALILLVVIAVSANLLPSVFYWRTAGKNMNITKIPVEAEVYGLRLRHLLTPVESHPWQPWRWMGEHLRPDLYPGENEARTSKLATLGSVGLFLMAFGSWAGERLRWQWAGRCQAAASLTLALFALATVGGIGSLFNAIVVPDIRCYNRVVVFIEFFCLLVLGWSLSHSRLAALPFFVKLIAVVCLALFAATDQVPAGIFTNLEAHRLRTWQSDQQFVAAIEKQLKGEAMVLQLPATSFPVDSPVPGMYPYEHGQLALHSSRLRWSWGEMMGRQRWVRTSEVLGPAKLIAHAQAAGFAGIVASVPANDGSIVSGLSQQLASPLFRSSDGRWAFFALPTASQSGVTLQSFCQVDTDWDSGFYPLETSGARSWRWAKQEATLVLENLRDGTCDVQLSAIVQTGFSTEDVVRISDDAAILIPLTTTSRGTPITFSTTLHPLEKRKIKFFTAARPVNAPGDSRMMHFSLVDFRLYLPER